MTGSRKSTRIEDYALIGDLHTASLVARDGSIDWLCAPRFDSGALFARLIGDETNGHWRLGPIGDDVTSKRRYRGDTLILETEHRVGDTRARVTDWMIPEQRHPVIVRMVEGLEGAVEFESVVTTRFDYGCVIPWARDVDGRLVLTGGPDAVVLTSEVPHERDSDRHESRAKFQIASGDRICFTLAYARSYDPLPDRVAAMESLAVTERFWLDWSARCTYAGPYREQVMRSLLTLKALSFAPTGGIVAAPTTSLPEAFGGGRNWDYRFCWLRDATFTLLALINSGFHTEAEQWRDWLIRAVAGDPAQLQVLYGVAGERRIAEAEIPWLQGFAGSKPVRVGNAASGQFQLDIYGETIDALMQVRQEGALPEPISRDIISALVDFVCDNRDRDDCGMWEIRGKQRAFTHSRVMAWAAFDRGVSLAERIGDTRHAEVWRRHRDAIHSEICERGYNAALGSFVQYYDSDRLDASTLLIPLVGFLPPDDPRIRGTIRAIETGLLRDGLVLRYDSAQGGVDGLAADDNPFLACSFWLADAYAISGRIDDAEALYHRLLGLCNDVGLLSEEYDVKHRRFSGNFPQAFSHVGLVSTALNIRAHREKNGRQQPRSRKRMSDGHQ